MVIPNMSLEGKAAIITGARQGLGKEIALTFALAGADVACCDLLVEDGKLEVVTEEIKGMGRSTLGIQVDISQKSQVDNMVQRVMDEFGAIDILVNNAGMVVRVPFLELSEDDWDRTLGVNLKGYYLCSQAAARRMAEQKKGNIISIASIVAMKAEINRTAYCVSKAGVVMLTRMMAVELASYNIRANAIAPTLMKTSFTEAIWRDPRKLEQAEAVIPLGFAAEPKDVVGTALFLASGASSYITGHTIVVDGGEMA